MIGCLERIVRALVLILPKMSRYVKTFKQKNNRLVPLRIDDENEKLLKKYETIWAKIEDLKYWIKYFTCLLWKMYKNWNKIWW